MESEVINRLIHGSRYRFGRSIVTILEAIECALAEGSDTLEHVHFEEAWGSREGCTPDQNVFAVIDWMAIELIDAGEEIAQMPRLTASSARKRRA